MRLAPFGFELRAFRVGELQRGAVIDRRLAAGELALALQLELLRRLVGGIEPAARFQLLDRGGVARRSGPTGAPPRPSRARARRDPRGCRRANSSVERSASVSSRRRRKRPPCFRANSQLNSAVRILPACSRPVGLGAKLTVTVIDKLLAEFVGDGIAAVAAEILGGDLHARRRLPALILGEIEHALDLLHHLRRMPARDDLGAAASPCSTRQFENVVEHVVRRQRVLVALVVLELGGRRLGEDILRDDDALRARGSPSAARGCGSAPAHRPASCRDP